MDDESNGSYRFIEEGNSLVVDVGGYLGRNNLPEFGREFRRKLNGYERAVFQFGPEAEIDSTTLAEVILAARREDKQIGVSITNNVSVRSSFVDLAKLKDMPNGQVGQKKFIDFVGL